MGFRFSCWLRLAVSVFLPLLGTVNTYATELVLAAANSTCDALKQVGDRYRASRPVEIKYLCKSSGLLAKGLSGGAINADIFISADREWMDYLVSRDLVSQNRVSSPWGNTLVVAVPKKTKLQLRDWQDLASDKVTIVMIGDPSSAPFGRYAKEALEASGLWEKVRMKIQTSKNIELLAAALADADATTAGILFRTNLNDQLRQLHTINSKFHKPIRYYVAPLNASLNKADVAAFIEFLHGRKAKEIFRAERFELIDN